MKASGRSNRGRYCRTAAEPLLILAVLLWWNPAFCAAGQAQTTDARLAILGSNVACRAHPSLSGRVVQRLAIAELVDDVTPRGAVPDWARVTTEGSATCFVSQRLVTSFDTADPESAVKAIVDSTNRLEGRIPFRRMAAVHALFEDRWKNITVEGSAEMELLELQVLERTAHTIDGWEDMARRPWTDRGSTHGSRRFPAICCCSRGLPRTGVRGTCQGSLSCLN